MTFKCTMRFEKQWNMQISNTDKPGRSNDPAWQFLASYSLSEFLSDHDNEVGSTAGLLFQMTRELGIPAEVLENIDMTLTGFAKEALLHFNQGSLELYACIRVFCQKKIINDENLAKTSRLYTVEQAAEHAHTIHSS